METLITLLILFAFGWWALRWVLRSAREASSPPPAAVPQVPGPASPVERQRYYGALGEMVDYFRDRITTEGVDRVTFSGGVSNPYAVEMLYECVGPAFDVYWRTLPNKNLDDEDASAGILVVERIPETRNVVITGIPTDDGRIIIDPTSEPEWFERAREEGWEFIYNDKPNDDGTIGVSYRRVARR